MITTLFITSLVLGVIGVVSLACGYKNDNIKLIVLSGFLSVIAFSLFILTIKGV